ncbi:MAG: ABC transporter permease [Acidobacteriota bacterium]
MSNLLADLRYALRSLRRAPLFTSVAVLSMAFGIAANAAVFTLVDQVMLRRLPVIRPGELVQIQPRGKESFGGGMGDGTELSYAMYRDLRDQNDVFAAMFCRMPTSLHVGFGGRTEQVAGELVSGTFFPVLGVRPALGRLFTPEDDRGRGDRPVVVLGFHHWRTRFNGDPAMVGRTITVNGHALEIIGVVQDGFAGLDVGQPVQVYVPMTLQPKMGPAWLQLEGRRFRWVQVFARLRDGVTAAGAQAGIQPLYRTLLHQESADAAFAEASADTKRNFLDGALAVQDASRGHSGLRESLTEPLTILMAIAGALLLIVCANVSNLLVARGAGRHRELALRLAVGAGRGRIVRLLLVESVVLAALGGAAGLLMASWGADVLLGYFASPDSPPAVTSGPDGRILAFTSALTLLTALLAGILPALRSTRMEVGPALKGAGGAVVNGQPRLRKSLVVAQVAISFLLLIAAGLFLRSLQNLMAVDPGFRTSRVLTFSFDLSRSGYDGERAQTFMKTFLERMPRTPGVSSAAFTFQSLLGNGGWGMGLTIDGYRPPRGDAAGAALNAVSPGYFNTMGIPLLAGREFDSRDDRAAALVKGWPYRVAVVNEAFAQRYFKGANPVGRHLGIGDNPGTPMPIEIVGLVKDTKYSSIREKQVAQVFFPYLESTIEYLTAYLHTSQDPAVVMQAVRREMAALDPAVAIYDVATLDDRLERSLMNERMVATLSGALGAMATLLSVMGLYAVLAYTVRQRTREIGIRMALGALGRNIAGGVMREAGVLVAFGLAIGLVAAWWLGRYVQNQLYGIVPADSRTILLATVTLTAVAGMAALLPARRAALLTPMAALRED